MDMHHVYSAPRLPDATWHRCARQADRLPRPDELTSPMALGPPVRVKGRAGR